MLRDITIENYRLFEKFRLEGMTQINLLVGANNSGKSSLLEAIYLFVNQNEPAALLEILDMRGEITPDSFRYSSTRVRGGYQILHIFRGHILREEHPIKISSLKELETSLTVSLVENYEEGNERQIKSSFEGIEDDAVEPELRLVFSYNDDIIRSVPISEDGLLIRRLAPGSGKDNRFVTTDYLDQREVAALWDQITLTPKEDRVLEALRILEPNVERLSFTSQQSPKSGILLKIKGGDYPVPLGSMGDGMRRILVLAASLVSSENGTLLVDEIDTGLHYDALTKMWRLVIETAKRLNVQVFATTHSWDCLSSFQKALSEANENNLGTVFRLERRNGQIDYVSYSGEEIDVAVEHDIEVR